MNNIIKSEKNTVNIFTIWGNKLFVVLTIFWKNWTVLEVLVFCFGRFDVYNIFCLKFTWLAYNIVLYFSICTSVYLHMRGCWFEGSQSNWQLSSPLTYCSLLLIFLDWGLRDHFSNKVISDLCLHHTNHCTSINVHYAL